MATRNTYQTTVTHHGLNKYRVIKAETEYELKQKERALTAQWNEQWARVVDRDKRKKSDDESEAYASAMSKQADDMQKALSEILLNSLKARRFDLNVLKDNSEFSEKRPAHPGFIEIPNEPNRSDEKYNPSPSFLTRISKTRMLEFDEQNTLLFKRDYEAWARRKNTIDMKNLEVLKGYNQAVSEWGTRKAEYERDQNEMNQNVDLLYERFKLGELESVERIYKHVFEGITLPFDYNNTIEVEYNPTGKMLIVDVLLPLLDDIPKLKSVSYNRTKKELKESFYPETHVKKTYENVLYQLVLLILNQAFNFDSDCTVVDAVVVNGKINTIDKATGKEIEPYILSVSVARTSFELINLAGVDAKAWFKSSKGVSAASLANTTPVAPVISMSREDKRFVEGYGVSDSLDSSVNLAAIDWQDFENLIREIFEKEFNVNGGEVKITQASRDGGVDAVAFDPDPIRGGKIVIQAKRYTNVVGVSAVRDLYGTVMNEGATKGILVTTSNYGNDAYNFAQGKPLTLMNGANLLYLLEKHGYKAKIDLKEAKDYLKA